MADQLEPRNRWKLTEEESRNLREFITAMVLNGQITADVAGLRPIDLYVLNLLDLDGESTPGELARRTALTTGAITKLIDRLARLGLVQRSHDLSDRRRVRLTIADKATENVGEGASLFTPIAKRMDDLISSYSEEHREVVFDFLVRATGELHDITNEMQGRRSRERAH